MSQDLPNSSAAPAFSAGKKSERTKQKLIDAVGKLLAEKGFMAIGVNAVAKQAGVDKVLIYRYFGGLNGLMAKYAESSDFWPTATEIIGDEIELQAIKQKPFSQQMIYFMNRYLAALLSRPLTQEILAWETVVTNEFTPILEEVREQLGRELMTALRPKHISDAELAAVSTVFVAAINYLVVRSRKIKNFNGINLQSDSGWQELMGTMEKMVSAFDAGE